MKIVQIIPGSGGSFYCGNCLRDSKFVEALRKEGHQVVKIPMYLPLFADEHDLTAEVPVFYGAVGLYLKQLFPLFRKAPSWFDRFINAPFFLKLAASLSGSTNAKGLEEMTFSMLQGEEGSQKEELEKLVDWLHRHERPDVVHLSNALLFGLARRIGEKLNVPVVCSLQDEDVWVDVMQPEQRDKIWKLIREKSADVDAFISVSHYFARLMQEKIGLPPGKVFTAYLGVDPGEYEVIPPSRKGRAIGYISRMCHDNGLDIAVEAFIRLSREPGFGDVTLVVTGGSTAADSLYLKQIRKRIAAAGCAGKVHFHDDFTDEGKRKFFRMVSISSVPVRNGEAFGLYLTELMASGIPVVQPSLGAFPEIVEVSGGGVTYSPNHPEVLAQAWMDVLSDGERLDTLSRCARAGVETHFNVYVQAEAMVRMYQEVINNRKDAARAE